MGDRLLCVDGRPVGGMHMPYIFKIVAGPAGSSVVLNLLRSLLRVGREGGREGGRQACRQAEREREGGRTGGRE